MRRREKPRGRRPIRRPRCSLVENVKVYLRENVWNGILLRIRAGGGLLRTQ
jgi:hypothetical protein